MAVVAYLQIDYKPEVKDKVLHLIQEAAGVLESQEGFRDMNSYRCVENSEYHVFITWESMEHHEACQRSPQWLMIMPVLSELMEEESLQLKLKFCEPL